jgi:hypothetical protein
MSDAAVPPENMPSNGVQIGLRRFIGTFSVAYTGRRDCWRAEVAKRCEIVAVGESSDGGSGGSGGETTTTANYSYLYGLDGSLAQSVGADRQAIVYSYNTAGQEVGETWYPTVADADAGTGSDGSESFSYDTLGDMLTAANSENGTDVASYNFHYDLAGDVTGVTAQLAAATSGSGGSSLPAVNLASTYDYNGNRLTLSANIGGTVSFSSTDGTFNEFTGWANDFVNTYTYDALGDMTNITQTALGGSGANSVTPKNVALGYDADQRLSSVAASQGTDYSDPVYSAAYTYDADSDLTGLKYTAGTGSSVLAAYHWDYAANGLVSDEYSYNDTASGASASTYTTWAKTSYGYDRDSELTSTSYSNFANAPASNTAEVFDANGNRAGESSAVGTGNRMLYDGTFYYAYDADGNRIAQYKSSTGALDSTATDITTYAWNEKNELTAVKQFATYADYAAGDDSTEIDYGYDAFGNMVSRNPTDFSGGSGGSGEGLEYFIYDGANVALILDGAKKGSELFILTEEEKVPGALIRGATTAQTVRAEEGGVRNRC